MFKKLLLPLVLAISANTHALTVEQFSILTEGDYRQGTIMYLGGVNDAVRVFSFYSNDNCEKWKKLSPNQFIAAFEAHYDDLDKQQLISIWAFEYALKHGGCADQ